MKAMQLKQTENTPFLKVVNNSLAKTSAIPEQVNRIYINTLMPGFNYTNSAGESITPNKCVSL